MRFLTPNSYLILCTLENSTWTLKARYIDVELPDQVSQSAISGLTNSMDDISSQGTGSFDARAVSRGVFASSDSKTTGPLNGVTASKETTIFNGKSISKSESTTVNGSSSSSSSFHSDALSTSQSTLMGSGYGDTSVFSENGDCAATASLADDSEASTLGGSQQDLSEAENESLLLQKMSSNSLSASTATASTQASASYAGNKYGKYGGKKRAHPYQNLVTASGKKMKNMRCSI